MRSHPLALGEDGSLDILLQADSPGVDREASWLPSPPDQEYFMLLRRNWLGPDFISGEWVQPAARRH